MAEKVSLSVTGDELRALLRWCPLVDQVGRTIPPTPHDERVALETALKLVTAGREAHGWTEALLLGPREIAVVKDRFARAEAADRVPKLRKVAKPTKSARKHVRTKPKPVTVSAGSVADNARLNDDDVDTWRSHDEALVK